MHLLGFHPKPREYFHKYEGGQKSGFFLVVNTHRVAIGGANQLECAAGARSDHLDDLFADILALQQTHERSGGVFQPFGDILDKADVARGNFRADLA